jgi:PAS domain S-box-containing protein
MNPPVVRQNAKAVAGFLALIFVYVAAGRFGLSLAIVNESASAVWPPTGIALAALLIWGLRLWPAIFVGAFLVNLLTPSPAGTSFIAMLVKDFGVAFGNTLEAFIGAWLVRRFAGGMEVCQRVRNVFKFFAFAGLFSTAISATIGVASLCVTGHAVWPDSGRIWLTWWTGDVAGAMMIAPLLIVWAKRSSITLTSRKIVEATFVLLIILFLGWANFLGGMPAIVTNQLKYVTLPPLLWGALRFQQRGAMTFVFLMSVMALWGTLRGVGPFVISDANESLLLLQTFLGTMAMMTLAVGAVMSERRQAEHRLRVQDAISRVLAETPELKEAAPKFIRALCEMAGWEMGAVWSVDRAANIIRCVDVWHLPTVKLTEFEAMTRRMTFSPGVGIPGTVWQTGQPVWLPDVTKESNFPRAPAAAKDGLHAAFCFPIKMGDEVVGALECFSRNVRERDDNFLTMLPAIGSQIGRVLEHRKAEDALRAKEAQLRTVTAITAVMLTQNDRDFRYTFVNRAYAERLGLSSEQVIGKTIAEVLGEEAFRAVKPYAERVLKGERVDYETAIPYARIGTRYMQVAYVPDLDEQGNVLGWVSSISDVTERKRTEAALADAQTKLQAHAEDLERTVAERTQELRETIAEIESFSYSISHDMRGPLRAMQGYASVLEQELKGKINDEERSYLGRIVASASRLNRLIEDILNYSQVSRTRMQLSPIDLQPLLLELVHQNPNLQPPFAEVRIDGPLPIVFGHETALTQVCVNLLGNAVKFIFPGSTALVRVWAETHGGRTRIWISDNGIGLEPKNHERIFQMFERVNSAKDYDGTGIGLAIVKRAVERMGGQIGVESELGKGARFWFELRCAGGV